MLPIDFSSQKTEGAKFLGHFDSQFRIYGHFQVFSKKFQRSIFPFRVFAVPVSRKMLLLLQFLRYRDAVCGILRTTKLATKIWEQNFEFLLQKLFRPIQSQIFFLNFFFEFGGFSKILGAKIQKPVPNVLQPIWLCVECRKPHLDILKTVGGVAFCVIQELRKRETEISTVEIFSKKPKNGRKS